MKGWVELKEAFWAVVEGGPAERERRRSELRAIDPSLPDALDALLAADGRNDRLMPLDDSGEERPVRIGEYDVVDRIGGGAMGEVYRARDPRLQRDVAIKVLRSGGWGHADRLARFEREARVLASLDHPRIAHVYGLETVDGAPAIVMELVQGPTLAELIRSAPDGVPLARTLALAGQIADGLSAAHERGVIHRDLKPGNIALTAQGDVKILDFGIAKRMSEEDPTSSAGDTIAGTMLGTPAYMSPEQARGESCDRRADVWAFGCVLVELLTGRSPFAHKSPSESLAAVLEHAPDLSALPSATPASIRALIRRCLEKEPSRRLRDMADVRLTLEDAHGTPGEPTATVPAPAGAADHPRRGVRRVRWAAATVVAALLVAAGWWARGSPGAPTRVVTALVLPKDLRLGSRSMAAQAAESNYAVSPDGQKIVLVATDSSAEGRLWIADLTSGAFQPLLGTEGATSPSWSPDSAQLAFIADGRLRTIPARGGAVVTLSASGFLAGSWNRQNQILFAPASRSPLYLVPAAGGDARQVTRLDAASGEVQHSLPLFLPDGRRFLYFSYGTVEGGSLAPRGVFVGSLNPQEPPRQLLTDARAVQYAAGHLLFVRKNTLMIQAFDPDRIVLSGTATSLIEDINPVNTGATGPTPGFSVSAAGVLAYQSQWTDTQLEVIDRSGAKANSVGDPGDIGDVAVSPDGTEVAVSRIDTVRGTRDLWVYPVAGGPGRRITFGSDDEFAPVWAPDGSRILYSVTQNGMVGLFVARASGVGDPRAVETDTAGLGRFASDWSRDGRFLLYVGGGRAIFRSDLWIAPLETPHEARALLDSTFVETHGRVAPDGRWFAYASNETGELEVYLDRFPDRGAKRVVSAGGGGWPRWSRDGRRLYYVAPNGHLMEVDVQATSAGLMPAPPRALLTLRERQPVRLDAYAYDVLPDGRFVANRVVAEPAASTISLVLNWRPPSSRR